MTFRLTAEGNILALVIAHLLIVLGSLTNPSHGRKRVIHSSVWTESDFIRVFTFPVCALCVLTVVVLFSTPSWFS
jgi:quinol-cytochrome oxidoreductase complex cytochrome b subunit